MTTLLFKKSLSDEKPFELTVRSWCSSKNGIHYCDALTGEWKFISSNDVYFWGVR